MAYVLRRPARDFGTGDLPLAVEHFQLGYVTNDLDAANAVFAAEFGISNFFRMTAPIPGGGSLVADLAWSGSVMYEIIEATGPGSEFFTQKLPTGEDFAIAFHHSGFLARSADHWNDLRASVARRGWSIPYLVDRRSRQVFMARPPFLDHFLEFINMGPAAIDALDAVVPRA